MKLTKCEKETVINFNEEDQFATVYTYNNRLLRRLEQLEIDKPDECIKQPLESFGSTTYHIPKGWIRINPPRILSEQQKKKQIENLRKKTGAQAI